MAQAFDHTELTACVGKHRQAAPAEVRLERITTGKFNTSYCVETPDESLVLRIAPDPNAVFLFYEKDMMRQEPGIHALLRRETSVPVAGILAYDDAHDVIDRDFLLMERLPGRPLCDTPSADAESVLRQVGECLAQAHRLTRDQYGYLGEHAPMPPQPTWAEAFHVMWRKLIDDIAGVGHYDQQEARALLALLDRHMALFDRPAPASLLHMDVWSQNILVDGQSTLTGLVDWDRALWGDPEIEIAVCDYCGISHPAFWEGYGQERDASREAQLRNVFYLLYEVQKYIVIREGRSHDSAAARRYKQQTMDMVRRVFGSLE